MTASPTLPQWLLNPVAVAERVAGFQYVHGTYLAPDGDDPATETPYGYTPDEVEALSSTRQARPADCTAANYCQHVHGSDTHLHHAAGQVPADSTSRSSISVTRQARQR